MRPAPSTRASPTPIQDHRANARFSEIFTVHHAAWMDAERRLQVHTAAEDEAASLHVRLTDAEAAPRIPPASHSTRLKTKVHTVSHSPRSTKISNQFTHLSLTLYES